MPNPPNITQITPPRVAFFDNRTGDISREWYRFFYNLYYATGGTSPGGAIPTDRGGTGTNVTPTNGQLLIGNDTTGAYTVANLGTGAGIAKTVGAGSLSIENTGVLSNIAGDGIAVDQATGDVTISNTGVLSVTAGQGIDVDQPTGDVTVAVGVQPYLDFDTTPSFTDQTGRIGWNDVDQTLNIGMDYGVVQQVGEETYARVKNNTGVTIPNGTVVGFAGASPNSLEVAPYLADGSSPTLYILGIMTHDLPDSGEKGYCTTWGFIRDLDTSAFSAGDILYASPSVAGALTNVKPTAPDNVIPIAACITSDAVAGVIFVRPTIEQMKYYGVFSKTSDQTPAVINTAYALTFDSTQISNGVVIGGTTSQIIVPQSGLYNFTATIQITSGNTSAKNVWVWFRENGTDILNSARLVTININNGYVPISLTETVSLAANEYVEIMFAASDTAITIDNVAATAFAPAAPAVVLQVTQVQQ